MAEEVDGVEMVLVPRVPTKEMIEAAYWDANDEDAAGVWGSMIRAWLASQQRKF
jgi:hypothetical protein